MNSKSKFLSTVFTGAFIALSMTPVIAASKPPHFWLGGTYCFEVGTHGAGDYQHLKLVVEPTFDTSSFKVSPVHALMRGMSGDDHYTDQLAGSATIAPSNDPDIKTPMLQIALSGNGYGITTEGANEIWTFDFNLQLDPGTLKGKMYGVESESKPLADGEPFEALQSSAVVRDITRISCRDF